MSFIRGILFVLFFFAICFKTTDSEIEEATAYWPYIAPDLTVVSWSHGTNSIASLQAALTNDSIMFIEADVNLGYLNGQTSGDKIPIMAHPPSIVSDLSLEDFMDRAIQATENGERKGIKLDFKLIDIVEESYEIVKLVEDRITFPFWVNADIVQGPGGTGTPVEPQEFLYLSKLYFPTSTLSTGFKTGYADSMPEENKRYTSQQTAAMLLELDEAGITQPVTFPVRAVYLAASVSEIQKLLNETPNSTITIWGTDQLDENEISSLRHAMDTIGRSKIYLDVPESLKSQLSSGAQALSVTFFLLLIMFILAVA